MRIVGGERVIRGQGRAIPTGLLGEVRRTARSRYLVDHHQDEVEFDLVVRGSGSYTLGETNYELRPGTLIWHGPGQRRRLARAPTLQMWVVLVRPEAFDAAWIGEITAQPLRALGGAELVDLDRLLSQVSQDSDDPPTYNAGIAYIIKRAQRASRDSPPAKVKPMHPAVARALLQLRESGGEMSLTKLAAAAGVASHYLSRLLIEHTNRNFVDWRNSIRLERFMAEYRPGTPLLTAALDAGFGSYARFHAIFTEMIGCAPSDWVNQAREGHPPPAAAASVAAEAPEAGDHGIQSAPALSIRQRWIRLLPLVSPSVGMMLGRPFLDRVLDAKPAPPRAHGPRMAVDAVLAPDAVNRLITATHVRDAAMAEELSRLISAHDFRNTYAGLLEVFDLSPRDVADAAGAFLLLLWTAIGGPGDPGQDQVAAVARQAAQALSHPGQTGDRQTAEDVHAALVCHFVIAFHALQAARASGDPRSLEQLSEAARAAAYEAFGNDLADITLSAGGFARR